MLEVERARDDVAQDLGAGLRELGVLLRLLLAVGDEEEAAAILRAEWPRATLVPDSAETEPLVAGLFNRDNSADSRIYSFIPRDQIIGRSSSVVFSLDSERNYLPRADRFMTELQ